MSHPDANEQSSADPIKLAIAVTVGAIALIVGIYLMAKFAIGTHTLGANNDAANKAEAVNARVGPIVQLAVDPSKGPVALVDASATPALAAATKPTAPAAAAPAVAIVPAAIPAAGASANAAAGGEAIYKTSCSACHAAGVAGAPKSGDKAAWAPRLAQGSQKLYEHAIKGFQGKSGVMPAKGGATQLSDAEVKSAVDYMIKVNK